jgi:hypothetical protein
LQISMQEMQDLQDGRFSTEGASRSAESHHRALEAAASALDRQQLRALERLIDAQLAELRATERSRRAQREAQGRAGGLPGTVR